MNGVIESRISLRYKVFIPAGLVFLSFVDHLVIQAKLPKYPSPPDAIVNRYYLFSLLIIWICGITVGILLKPQKITVSDYGILFYGNLFNKQRRIVWDEIKSIAFADQTQTAARNIEYYSQVLQIELKNGDEMYISSTEYENYDLLKAAIYQFLRQGRRNDPL